MSEKIYRVSVVIVLLLILAVQVYAQFKPQPAVSAVCTAAIQDAQKVADKMETFIVTDLTLYKKAVYETSENINQQNFMAGEYTYLSTFHLNELLRAQLNVSLQCR
jgi:hypothetical protein